MNHFVKSIFVSYHTLVVCFLGVPVVSCHTKYEMSSSVNIMCEIVVFFNILEKVILAKFLFF